MAENKIVIDVEVQGADEAKKDLNQVAQGTQAIGDQSKKSNKNVNTEETTYRGSKARVIKETDNSKPKIRGTGKSIKNNSA